MKIANLILFGGALLVCTLKATAEMKPPPNVVRQLAQLAQQSRDLDDAQQRFSRDETLRELASFQRDDRGRKWTVTLKSPISARDLCSALGLERCYLVSQDVHQNGFWLNVWTEDLRDEYGPRIACRMPRVNAWTLDAKGTRPPGDLPGISCGASPAYAVPKYDTQISVVSFRKESK